MSSLSSKLFPKKTPFIVHKLNLHTDFNKKYAPKFVNQVHIYYEDHLHFRTRYLKKVSSLVCSPSWFEPYDSPCMKPVLLKIAKRFNKHCKGDINLDPKILSSFSLLEKCHINSVFHVPLHLKLGRFAKLLLSYKTFPRKHSLPRDSSEISQQVSKIVTNIKRSKHLKNLKIEFDEDTLDISAPLLLQFEKYPLLLSSLSNFALHYQSLRHGDPLRFSNSLSNLKDITHLSVKTNVYEAVKVNLHEFTKLNYLSVNLEYYDKACTKGLISLETLTNLETFRFKASIRTLDQIEDLLMNFRPPKSINTLNLALTIHWSKLLPLTNTALKKSFFSKFIENISFLKPKTRNQTLKSSFEKFFEEEWDPAKGFYERWNHLHKLSHLELNFPGSPKYDDINFFFIAPILKRCQNLKKLVLSTHCGPNQTSNLPEHQRLLHWSQILQALGSSKDLLEDLKLTVCHMNFDQKSSLNLTTLKNLKNLNLKIRMIETKHLPFIHNTLPRGLNGPQFSYNLILFHGKEIKELFAFLKSIPKYFQVFLDLSLSKQSSQIFERELFHYLSSTRIEGHIHINLCQRGSLNLQQLKDSLAKQLVELAPTGSLKIKNLGFTTIFKSKKTDIFYCLD